MKPTPPPSASASAPQQDTLAATPDRPMSNGASASSTSRSGLAWWQSTQRWVAHNTFVPSWLPEPLCRPAAGYALAVALQVLATLATLLLVTASPTFSFPGIITILGVALVALSWGAAPSLLATAVGTFLLELVVLPHTVHGGVTHTGDMVEIVVCLAVGAVIGIVASGTEQARRRAVDDYAQAQARELALSETHARTDEFLSIASHELRSPLTSLKAALQLGERRLSRLSIRGSSGTCPEDLTSQIESVMDLLATAEHQVDRQNRLVGDLLDVSRIRAGRLEFYQAPCDLAAVVRDAVDEQRLSWPDRAISLHSPDGTVPVQADAMRIGQVVTNFLTNALKYSPPDAPVSVTLLADAAQARVAVRDSGPGLSREQQAHIWDRFHRVPGVKQQSGSGAGLGLGLYICRTIVEHHSGQIGIESTPGTGSTFWFTLPLARP